MKTPASVVALRAWDGLRNLVSGVGTGKDKATAWRYIYEPLDLQQIHAMYTSDWLARKIVDIVPEDMTREWRIWQSERAEDYYKAERQLQIRSKVQEALTIARLDGGAAILIGDGAKDAEKPINFDRLGRGGIKYLHVFSKTELTGTDPILDINDPNYLCSEFFEINTEGGAITTRVKIHRSRFMFIKGAKVPRSLAGVGTDDSEWGLSIFQAIASAIKDASSIAANAASLANEAKIDVLKIPELDQRLSDDEGTRRLTERMTLANTMKSTVNTLLIANDEEWDRKEVNLSAFPDLMRSHLQIASGAADIPVTRLLGQSPAGLNATGDSDIRNYYDMTRSKQKGFEESLEPLDRALKRHVTGAEPDGDTYEWIPLWQMTEAEEATIAKQKADTVQIYINSNLFAPEELRPAVADMLIEDAFLPTLDQHLLGEDDFYALLQEKADQQQAAMEEQAAAAQGGREEDQGDGGEPGLKVIQGGRRDSQRDERATPFEIEDYSQDAGFGQFEESEHPRGSGGKFAEKPDQTTNPLAAKFAVKSKKAKRKKGVQITWTATKGSRGNDIYEGEHDGHKFKVDVSMGGWADIYVDDIKAGGQSLTTVEEMAKKIQKDPDKYVEMAKVAEAKDKERKAAYAKEAEQSKKNEEGVLKEWESDEGTITAFHGTTSDVADDIMKNGIVVNPGIRRWEDEGLYKGTRGESVYVASSSEGAKFWAKSALSTAPTGARAVVFELRIPKGEWAKFKSQEAEIIGSIIPERHNEAFAKHSIPPDWIMSATTVRDASTSGKFLVLIVDDETIITLAIEEDESEVRDAGFAVSGEEFQEQEHPRDPSGKFKLKGPTGFVSKGPSFIPSKSAEDHVKRVQKALQGKAIKGATYRFKLDHFAEEAQFLAANKLLSEAKAQEHITKLKEKVGESWWIQALEAKDAGKGPLYNKLAIKAKSFGFKPPGEELSKPAPEPVAAPKPQIKNHPWAELSWDEQVKVYQEWKKFNPNSSMPDWDKLPLNEKYDLYQFMQGNKAAAAVPKTDPQTQWNSLSSGEKSDAEMAFYKANKQEYYESQLAMFEEYKEPGEHLDNEIEQDLKEKAQGLMEDDWIELSPEGKLEWAKKAGVVKPEQEEVTPSVTTSANDLVDPEFEKEHPRGAGGLFIEKADTWQPVGPQKGSNPGGTVKDPRGQLWYAKIPKTADHVLNDLLANRLYADAGLAVPYEKAIMLNEKEAIASKIVKDGVTLANLSGTKKQEAIAKLRLGFAVDAWLANWDIVGLAEDNVLVNGAGTVIRVDQGGSLKYRAQGEPKAAFGQFALEFDTLRNPNTNPQSAKVFKDLTVDELKQSAKLLNSVSESLIIQRTKEMQQENMAAILIARRQDVLAKIGTEIAEKSKGVVNPPVPEAPKTYYVAPPAPVPSSVGGTPIASVPNLSPDQKKALSTLAVTHLQTEGIPEAAAAIKAFNSTWEGQPINTLEQANEKVKQFNELKQKVQTLKVTKAAEGDKTLSTIFGTPEAKEHLAVLATVGIGDPHYLKSAAEEMKSKGFSNLEPTDAGYLKAYTGAAYREINKALRKNTLKVDQYKYVKGLNNALDKLPEFKGQVWRKTDLPSDVAESLQPGNVAILRGFTSTSKSPNVWSGQYTFVIEKSFSGRDVAKISQHPHEQEVLFKSNTGFLVTKRSGNTIYMEEFEP